MIRQIGIDIGSYSFNKVTQAVTLIGLPTISQWQIKVITHVPTSTIIYNFADWTGTGGTYVPSTGVLTLAYNTNTWAFNNTDELIILVDWLDMNGYDINQDVIKVMVMNTDSTVRTDYEPIIASAYTLTSTPTAQWPVLSTAMYKDWALFFGITIQNSIGIKVQLKWLRSYTDTNEYPLSQYIERDWYTDIKPNITKFPDWNNILMPIDISIRNVYPYFKVYIRCDTPGATPWTLNTLDVTKWR